MKYVVKIIPLTPLWTGDATRQGQRVRETGIIGSLRWWYETVLRSLRYYACDPSGGCQYDHEQGLRSICLACQVFGASGYGRCFRLVVEGDGDAGRPIEVKLRNPGTQPHRGWRIPGRLAGPITLSFLPMKPEGFDIHEGAALYYTVRFIERYGALGGKTSQGQGVIQVIDWGDLNNTLAFADWLEEINKRPAKRFGDQPAGWPNLRHFVGANVLIDDGKLQAQQLWSCLSLNGISAGRTWEPREADKWVPSSPAIRAQLRDWLRNSGNFPGFRGNLHVVRHHLMGTVGERWNDPNPNQTDRGWRDRPKGSDVFVTHFYKLEGRWTMRIFAFIPTNGNEVDKKLRSLLTTPSELKEFLKPVLGGLHAKVTPYPTDVKSLFGVTEGGQT